MGKPHVNQQQQRSADQEVLVQVNQFLLLKREVMVKLWSSNLWCTSRTLVEMSLQLQLIHARCQQEPVVFALGSQPSQGPQEDLLVSLLAAEKIAWTPLLRPTLRPHLLNLAY